MRPERRLPLIIATALFIENMDSTAISTSLPQIAAELGTEPVALKLALTTYMLALAVFIPVSGWVADRFGARRIFVGAIAVFLAGSLCCAASDGLGTLVAGRFVQGIGGAMMVPVGRLVLLRSIEKAELVRALSWLTVPAMLGPMLGPVLGGAITTYTHWRFIFLINLPMGLLGMWLAWRFVPELRQPVGRMDWRGFALSAGGLGLAMFGLSAIGRGLVPGAAIAGVVLAGTGLLGWAAWRQALLPQTMLAWAADHRTATGEQRDVMLPDGTLVRLNTASAFNVDYSDSLRRIVVREGEIFVSTAADARRPFVVDTVHGRLRALGTRFNVRQTEDATQLAVYQGAVEVRPNANGSATIIDAGWQAGFTRTAIEAPTAHDAADPAWTRGLLIADNLPLRDVVRELRRYRRGHIGLHEGIADLKVYGNLPLDDTDRALLMLTTVLPVRIRETFPWWVSIEPAT